ncbi:MULTISPECIES: heat resistance membrane protein HdeD-GI [Pseudomonadota]|uniref:heat resistance membrane protein HdeD-GI n=1 Tax=Pseudomonadota TaxID=1224 RepID=UPI00053D3414|nr:MULTISPECIES: heat resistance membrane protein HdeD-GI [Pseudomonadota]MBR8087617.1 heat resistance membrane protein HdeD-GI [Burkholderia vietnamiensis]MCA8232230.1 heat resistance membrane protein HdeD-GI [Burkholderia vietnamiensis]MCO2558045.1 heat resistance membrane protein HdeD-GI [Pseudomonas aeruginosa]MDH7552004.1 heat resistance membrane protein HdeD-GI [Stenotrophomonas geniculata]MDN7820874.1 heat resistance membrane protein HdeD-GI [Burkholderia vietnamiensis]
MNTDAITDSSADEPTKTLCSLTENWWIFALRGVLALIFAALAFWMPQSALLAMTLVFGAFSLVNGAFNLVAAVRHIQKKERWGWLLFSGIVGILTGVVVLVAPWVATMVMASFLWASVGFWAIFTGVLEISAAVRLRQEIKGEIWLAFSGLLSIVLGAIVLWIFFSRPVESFLAAGWLLGFYAAVYGVTLLFLSWRLRKTRQG